MKKIKNIVIVLFLICLVVACGESTTKDKPKKASTRIENGIPNVLTPDGDFHVYDIDSCEYITYRIGSNGGLLTHKGNCKFCKERNKK